MLIIPRAEHKFRERVSDYHLVERARVLPSPFGRGQDWYKDAIRAVEDFLMRQKLLSKGAKRHWKAHWPKTNLCKELQAERMLVIWQNGLQWLASDIGGIAAVKVPYGK